MTTRAERVLEEIRGLEPVDLQAVWEQVSRMVAGKDNASQATPPCITDHEFKAALDEITGCIEGSGSLERLLQERHQELEMERIRF